MSLPPPAPDDEHLARYLLGALPDEETERLDELSIADTSFADRLNAVEFDLVDSYVSGELSGDMLAHFKSRCRSSPAMRDKVKVAESLAAYQRRSSGQERGSFGAESWSRWALAAAASLALVATGYLTLETRRLRTEVAESRAASASSAERERALQRQLDERRAAADESERALASARDDLAQLEGALETGRLRTELQRQLDERRAAADEAQLPLGRARDALAQCEGALETRRPRSEVAESRAASASSAERERALQRQLDERRAAADESEKALTRARDALAQLEARVNAPVGRPVVAAFLLTPARRGVGDVTTIAIPRGAAAIALLMEPEADEFARYRASIKELASDRVVWRSGELTPKPSGAAKIVEATVPSALLKPQTYSVEITGVPARGAPGRFAGSFVFRVMAP